MRCSASATKLSASTTFASWTVRPSRASEFCCDGVIPIEFAARKLLIIPSQIGKDYIEIRSAFTMRSALQHREELCRQRSEVAHEPKYSRGTFKFHHSGISP